MSAATTAATTAATSTVVMDDDKTIEEHTLRECLDKSEMTVEQAMNKTVETFCTKPPEPAPEGAGAVILFMIAVVVFGVAGWWFYNWITS